MCTTTEIEVLNLGPADGIPLGEGRTVRAAGVEIAVFRTRQGGIFATQADCPHRAGPLADGLVGDGKVVCPLHGHAFRLSTGEPLRRECPALRTYPVRVSAAGEVLVTLAPGPEVEDA